MGKPVLKCAVCGNEITFTYKPMPQWDISGSLCGPCYGIKLLEHYVAPERRDITKK